MRNLTHVLVKTPKGVVKLRVPAPDGLSESGAPASEFVIKSIDLDLAMGYYDELVDYVSPTVAMMEQRLLDGDDGFEVPFLNTDDPLHPRLTNDAHIVKALYVLGATAIPVVVHQGMAARI
jgi:hypothetical protein